MDKPKASSSSMIYKGAVAEFSCSPVSLSTWDTIRFLIGAMSAFMHDPNVELTYLQKIL